MKNCPDVEVKYVIKDKTEWDQFIQSVCRSYGFVLPKSSSVVVYTLEGKLIGGGNEFVDYVREQFDGTKINVPKEQLKARKALNEQENQDRMNKMKEGKNMAERIEERMDKITSKKQMIQLIDDCFYTEHIE